MRLTDRGSSLGVLVLALIGSGCAFTSQTAMLRPEFNIAQTTRGNGARVLVTVVDERSDQDFGRRGTGALRGATVHADQDIGSVIREAVSKGLSQLQFRPVAEGEVDRTLKIEVREIKYETSTGFFTGGIHTSAAIKALAERGGESLERFYRASDEVRVLFVPFAESNEEMLNTVVNDVLTQLFADYELIGFLAAGASP